MKGKGYELHDIEKVMNMYRNWHMELKPKSEFGYFAEQLSKMSGKREIKDHMEKLRGVYRGELDHFVPGNDGTDINLKEGLPAAPVQAAPEASGAQGFNKEAENAQFSYQDYGNHDEKANNYQDNAYDPVQFRMLDGE